MFILFFFSSEYSANNSNPLIYKIEFVFSLGGNTYNIPLPTYATPTFFFS